VIDQRQEYAANLLLDDSTLRGKLTDDQFQPLLEWALTWTDGYAASTVGLPDRVDWKPYVDRGVAWVRTQLKAIVAMLESWHGRPPLARAHALAALAPSFPAPRLAAAAERIARLPDPAREIAERLPPGPQ
jgi:hypothetical protein